jgi:exodeoxyribonuclease V alpha subunit
MSSQDTIKGIVNTVEKATKTNGTWSKEKRFTIYTVKSKKTFKCETNGSFSYCDVKKGDSIWAVGSYNAKNNMFTLESIPIVEPSVTKPNLLEAISEALTINSSYSNKRNDWIKGIGFANLLFDVIVKKLSEGEKLSDVEKGSIFNEYLIEVSNNFKKAKEEAGPEIYKDMLEALTESQCSLVLNYWYFKRERRKLMMLGIYDREIDAAKMNTNDLYNKIRNNPYTVASISSDRCEEFVDKFGLEPTDDQRTRGAILRTVYWYNINNNWTYVPILNLKKKYPDIDRHKAALSADIDPEAGTVGGYGLRFEYLGEMELVYTRLSLQAEIYVTEVLARLMKKGEAEKIEPTYKLKTLTEEQKYAIKGSLVDPVTVITGGAGTGKTTIVSEVINNLNLRRQYWLLAAPTGKAVVRATEAMEANKVDISAGHMSTMHRAIYKPPDNARDITHIFLDESSMITLELMEEFLPIFPSLRHLIFIGDCNQLRPIGWGFVFKEVIESGTVPVYRLSKNHRCYEIDGEFDGVAYNSNIIANRPKDTPFEFQEEDNFKLIEGGVEAVNCVIKAMHMNGVKDTNLMIVTPRNEERKEISKYYQSIYRKDEKAIKDEEGFEYRINDKVMMLENTYDDVNVMNGELGRVIGVDDINRRIRVTFNKNWVKNLTDDPIEREIRAFDFNLDYPPKSYFDRMKKNKKLTTKTLALAYGLTVHKAQGDESEHLVLFVPQGLTWVDKNIIYTAITRGRRCVHIVGDLSGTTTAAGTEPKFRHDKLNYRLNKELPKTNKGVDQRSYKIRNAERDAEQDDDSDEGF